MRKIYTRLLFFILTILIGFSSFSQNDNVPKERLKVFMDCQSGCDMNHIRTEINIVDFLLDRVAADVHVLITDQNTGSGGDRYQLIFYGQNQFRNLVDTIYFNNEADNTDFEEREMLLKYLKLGLSSFIAKTNMAKYVSIQMRTDKPMEAGKKDSAGALKDPWNYWVFRIDANGNASAEESYKELRIGGGLSASRVTDDLKLAIELYGDENKSTYKYQDSSGIRRQINKKDNYSLYHYLIKSIDDHWSWAYESSLSRSTFSNNKRRIQFRTGIEYNIFPYKESNTKYLTIAYLVDVRHNRYFDTTLYNKTKEVLFGHGLQSKITFNQKWGTIEMGAKYHNYLHQWKYLNLGADCEINVRVTGGLSFYISTYAELRRDEIYLSKAGATPEEVLTRQKQLASGYFFYSSIGINYRFGSKVNNFVNPRFDD